MWPPSSGCGPASTTAPAGYAASGYASSPSSAYGPAAKRTDSTTRASGGQSDGIGGLRRRGEGEFLHEVAEEDRQLQPLLHVALDLDLPGEEGIMRRQPAAD